MHHFHYNIGHMYDFYDDDEIDEQAEESEIFFTDMRKLIDVMEDVEEELEDLPDEEADVDF